MVEQIEVYRDMTLHGPVAKKAELRSALIAAAASPWRFDVERSAEVMGQTVTSDDVLIFRCEPNNGIPAVGLTLWETEDGYYVPNIVPVEMGNLTYRQYNAALDDFIVRIVEPIAQKFDFAVNATDSSQSLEDWVSSDTAVKLRRFSANKSTGASHPMDERRWFDFVVAVHRANDKLDPSKLARWLNEAEGWDDDAAHKLAGDFENGLALLAHYENS
jgi:hypothetical protein